jgi:hypothetical protein
LSLEYNRAARVRVCRIVFYHIPVGAGGKVHVRAEATKQFLLASASKALVIVTLGLLIIVGFHLVDAERHWDIYSTLVATSKQSQTTMPGSATSLGGTPPTPSISTGAVTSAAPLSPPAPLSPTASPTPAPFPTPPQAPTPAATPTAPALPTPATAPAAVTAPTPTAVPTPTVFPTPASVPSPASSPTPAAIPTPPLAPTTSVSPVK